MTKPFRQRGTVLVMALFLSTLSVMMASSAFVMLRSGAQRLDQRLAFDRAQALAAGALDEALARLDTGALKLSDQKGADMAWKVETRSEGTDVLVLLIAGHARAETWEVQDPTKAWATVRAQAWAVRTSGGTWIVRRYVLLNRLFEARGALP